MFGNCNHCCFCCGHPCTMLGVSLFISCKNKIQCVCVEKKQKTTHLLSIAVLKKKIKYKERILKTTREKHQITYRRIPIRLTADLSAETLQARREWQEIFKWMKAKNLQPRLLYPAGISFRFDREIKTFTDKQKLR